MEYNRSYPTIKICGIRTATEAGYLNKARVEYAGVVFYEPSKRYVPVTKAGELIGALDKDIKKVAVTVSPDVALVKEIEKMGFDILQVHKDLSTDVLKSVSIPVWYACNMEDEEAFALKLSFMDDLPDDLRHKIDGIVADAADFGSGKTFNWRKDPDGGKTDKASGYVAGLKGKKFILAGGLNADNVTQGIRIYDPDVVDVSSAVEGDRGKDEKKIKEFVARVRGTEVPKEISHE